MNRLDRTHNTRFNLNELLIVPKHTNKYGQRS